MDETKAWHAIPAEQATAALSTDAASGLSSEEVQRRLEVYGPNTVERDRKASSVRLFLGQFKNILIVILLLAITVSAALGEVIDAIVIGVIVVLAAVTGFIQEYRAEKVFEALKRRLSPTCTTVRDGVRRVVPAASLVPGDIVVFEAGARVPADARLVQVAAMQVDESPLTGESVPVVKTVAPVPKQASVEERVNMAFAGTTVTYGRGIGTIVATGARTEFGKIVAETMELRKEQTPLERQVSSVGRNFGIIGLVVILVVAAGEAGSALLANDLTFSSIVGILLFGISLGVAVVPEALPAIVTATLAIGMRILARNNALIRRMAAVETLGSTEVICFDKTGTLTKGEMTVREVYAGEGRFQVAGAGYAPKGALLIDGRELDAVPPALQELGAAALHCNDATLHETTPGRWEVIGDPTEGALTVLAGKLGLNFSSGKESRIAEIPFNSERKLMTTIHRLDGLTVGYMKGAPDSVFPRCATRQSGGGVVEFDGAAMESVSKVYEDLAGRGLRVLALASRHFESIPPTWDEAAEANFVFLGLVGMEDPLREDANKAVERARTAGMRPVMITGDHRTTAVAIAGQAGIFRAGDEVLTGQELQQVSDSDLAERVERVSVYARISPLDKLKIVNAWKKKDKTVAMTGDGVNDAPALKRADIGVAMGLSGTDVAKEAADVVLTDDDFASIVRAVELGRWIYDNIKKYLVYLLQANLVEIAVLALIALIVSPLLGIRDALVPLLPVQLLYVNLATDGLPALALGFSPVDSDLLRRPPRRRDEPVFTRDLTFFFVSVIATQVPLLLAAFVTGAAESIEAARSRVFLMLIFMELALAINCRSLSLPLSKARPHRWLVAAVLWEAFLIIALVEIPQSRNALHVLTPGLQDILWILAAIALSFLTCETVKRLRKGAT